MASTAATAPEEEEEKAPQFSSEQLHQLLMELLPQKNEQQQCPNGRRHCAAAAGTSGAANAAALSSSGSVQQQQHKVRQSTTTSRRSNKAKQQQRRVPQPTESEDPSAASPASPPFAALDNHNSFGADQLLAALAAVASASTALQDPTTTAISLEELGKAMLEQMGREFGEQAHQMFAALAELAPGASPDELADAAALAMAAQLGLQQQQQMDTMATGTAAFWQQMLAQMGTTAAQEKDDSGIVADQSMEQEAQMLFPLPLMPSPPATVPSLPPPRAPKRRRPPISSQPPAVPLPTSNQNEQQLQQVLMEWMAQMMQQPQQNQSDNANGHGQQQQGMQALVEAALAGGLMGAEELAQALLQQMVPEGDQKSDFDNSTTTTGADDAQERKNYGTTQQAITPIGHKQRNLCAIGKGIVDNVNSDAANIVAAAPEQSPPPLVFEPNALCQQLLIAQNGQQQQQHMGAGEAATWQQQLALQQVLAQLGSAVNSSNGNGNSGFQLDQQQQQLLALSAAMLPTNVQLMEALLPSTRQEQSHDTQHQVKVEPQQQQEEVHKHTDAENNNVPLSLFAELKSEEGENGTTVATMLLAHGQQQQQQQRRKKPREGKRQHIGGQMPGMGVQQQQTPRLCTVPGTGTLTAKSEKSLGALLRQQPEGVERAKELEELEQFANFFKKQRIRYGFTQGDVGVALGKRYGTDFSQTTISRFEALNLSFKNMCKLRPLLQDWLHETEQVLAAGASVQDVMEGVALRRVAAAVAVPNEAANAAAAPCSQQSSPGSGGFLACTGATAAALDEGPTAKMLPPFKKRRKRTNLDSAQKVSLDAFFRIDPRPDNVRMNEIATLLDLEQDVVRVWFCNRRQKLRKL